MTTVPVAYPAEDTAAFEIVHRGARVRTAFGSAELANALRGPFESYGAEIVKPDFRRS